MFASAISACFIPVFSEYLTRKGREPAFRFAGCFITVMGLLSAVLSVLGILFAGPLVSLFADGYDAQTAELAVSLTRVMFPTVLFTGVAFSFVGVLQSLGEFNVPALISVVSNLVIILYYLTLDQQFGIYGLAVAFWWAGSSRRRSRCPHCAGWASATGRDWSRAPRGCGRSLP